MFNFFKKKEIASVPDWKKKVGEWNTREAELKRVTFDKEQKLLMEQTKAAQKAEREKLLTYLGASFQCHICHTPSKQPLIIEGKYVDQGMGCGYMEGDTTHWNQPGDLWQCNECNEWTCKDDLHNHICKNCWSNKIGQKL